MRKKQQCVHMERCLWANAKSRFHSRFLCAAPSCSCAPQGLFHPARKVREVYWRIYNNLYIGAQDALVAAYPRLEDEPNNTYSRPELDMFI